MTFNFRKIVGIWGLLILLSVIISATPNTKICRKRHGKFPKVGTLCKMYYNCKNWVPVEMTCPDGEHFNPVKEWCDWEDLYPCLERPKDKECLRENGLFLKPETNCKKFYRCCNGKAKVENCPGDTIFDPSKGNCEWPNLYTCIESISTTQKVTSAETTFETSTPSDDQKDKSSTPAISKTPESTTKFPTTFVTKEITTPLPTSEIPTTLEPKESSTAPPTTKIPTTLEPKEISTPRPTTAIPTTLEPKEISTIPPTTEIPTTVEPKEVSTPHPTTEIPSTIEPKEISTPRPTSEIPTTLEPKEISTPLPTTEIPTTLEPKDISSHSTDHTISKENKEFEITDPTVFETMEETFSPSTVEVTTSVEDLLRNFLCPEPTGHFPHPTNKHKFIACVNNNRYIMDCPHNLVYIHRLRRCDYEKKLF